MNKLLLPALVVAGGLIVAKRSKAKPAKTTTKPPELSPFRPGTDCAELAEDAVVAQWTEDKFRPAAIVLIGTHPLPPPPAEPPEGADDATYDQYEADYADYRASVLEAFLGLTEQALERSLPAACYDSNTDAYAEVFKAAWLAIVVEYASRGQVDEEIGELLDVASTPGFDPRDPATYPVDEPEVDEPEPIPDEPPLPPIPEPDPDPAPPQPPPPEAMPGLDAGGVWTPVDPPIPDLPPPATWPPSNAAALHTKQEFDNVRLVDLVEAVPEMAAPQVPIRRAVLLAYEPSWEHATEMLEAFYNAAAAAPGVDFYLVSFDDTRKAYGQPHPHEFVRYFVTAVSRDGYGWQYPIVGLGHAAPPMALLLWDNAIEYAHDRHVGDAMAVIAVAGVGQRRSRGRTRGMSLTAAFRRVLSAERIRAINVIARARQATTDGPPRSARKSRTSRRRRRGRRGMAA